MDSLSGGLVRYFDGWERFGVKEDDGSISSIPPEQIPMVRRQDEEIFYGPDGDVRRLFRLHDNLKEKDLEKHRDPDGQWKPGRLVVESRPGNYQVWVRYEDEHGKDSGLSWDKMDPGGKVLHCDEEHSEKTKVMAKTQPMSPVMQKLGKYFGEYEYGVYKEAVGEKDGAVWKVNPKAESVNYLKAMNAQGKHIFIRPSFEKEPNFMMHDDLNREGLAKYHQDANGKWKPGRLVVESSPGNYQVWIKTDRSLSVEEKTHWLGKMNSDPGASPLHRWGRAPGFRNRKEKYQTDKGYPLARLEWIDWIKVATVPQMEKPVIEEKAEPPKTLPRRLNTPPCAKEKGLPTRERFYKGVDAKGKVMESEQDFAYMLALLRRGVSPEEVKARVRNERTDWENHKGPKRMEHYLDESLKKAQGIVGQSRYRIDIHRRGKKIKSIPVSYVPTGHNHQTYLDRYARNIIVKEGHSPEGLSVKVTRDTPPIHEKQQERSYAKVMVRAN